MTCYSPAHTSSYAHIGFHLHLLHSPAPVAIGDATPCPAGTVVVGEERGALYREPGTDRRRLWPAAPGGTVFRRSAGHEPLLHAGSYQLCLRPALCQSGQRRCSAE